MTSSRILRVIKATGKVSFFCCLVGISGALITGNPIFLSATTTSLFPTVWCLYETIPRSENPNAKFNFPPKYRDVLDGIKHFNMITTFPSIFTNLGMRIIGTTTIPILSQILLSVLGTGVLVSGIQTFRFFNDQRDIRSTHEEHHRRVQFNAS